MFRRLVHDELTSKIKLVHKQKIYCKKNQKSVFLTIVYTFLNNWYLQSYITSPSYDFWCNEIVCNRSSRFYKILFIYSFWTSLQEAGWRLEHPFSIHFLRWFKNYLRKIKKGLLYFLYKICSKQSTLFCLTNILNISDIYNCIENKIRHSKAG